MDAQRLARVAEIFHRALATPSEKRPELLASSCGGDDELRLEIEELIAAAAREETALDRSFARSAGGASPPPERIGKYRVERLIGPGGSSLVYLAEEEGQGFHRPVALKVLAGPQPPALAARFEAETRILAGLEHPGIARLYDAGLSEAGATFLAMEYVEGETIVAHCRERRLGLGERLAIFVQVLEAVSFAHRNLVVHRDLKPANILVSRAGRAKLLDFGIARLLDPAGADEPAATATWLRALTPFYASPEQIRGERLTTSTDVYSLGVVLYELLAERRPFSEDDSTRAALERAFRADEPAPPSIARRERADPSPPHWRELSGDLDAIVLRALRRDPRERYRSVEAFAEDLGAHLGGLPVKARRGTLSYRASRFLRRHAGAVATAVAVLAGSAAGIVWHTQRLDRERDLAHAAALEAEREARRAERVVELLSGIFDAASPYEAAGRPLSGRQLVEGGGARVERSLLGDPETRAQLQVVFGGIWSQLGDYQRANELLEPAVRVLEQSLGLEHRATAAAWTALARIRHRQGRFAEARQLEERAIAVERRVVGREPALADTLNAYGNTLKSLGEFAAGRAALEEAITIYGETLGPESPALGKALGNLGLVLERQEDWQGAAAAHQRSIEVLRGAYGSQSPVPVVGMTNLANVRSHQHRDGEAVALLREALRVNQAALGEGYAGESNLRNYLAFAYFDQRRYEEARAEFGRAVAVAIAEKGASHPDVAWPTRGLAMVEAATGHLAAARALDERVLALREAARGAEHWEVAQSLDDLASLAERAGDRAAQIRYLRRALAVHRKVDDPGHPQTARAAARLGGALCAAGDREGRALLEEAIALRQSAPAGNAEELAEWRATAARCEPLS
jgi:serine/threonine-protein kinase